MEGWRYGGENLYSKDRKKKNQKRQERVHITILEEVGTLILSS